MNEDFNLENVSDVKKRYIELIKAISEELKDDPEFRDELLNFIDSEMKKFIAYEQSIQNAEILIPVLRYTKEGEDLIYGIESLDKERRMRHDAAIGTVNSLNRQCKIYDVEPISKFTYEDYKLPSDKSPTDNKDFRDAVEEFSVNIAREFSNDELYQQLKADRSLEKLSINHNEILKECGLEDFINDNNDTLSEQSINNKDIQEMEL